MSMSEMKRIERSTKLDELKFEVLDLSQAIPLDYIEEDFAFGAGLALKRADARWDWAHMQLSNLEAHMKAKLDKVHKLNVAVKREAKRMKL